MITILRTQEPPLCLEQEQRKKNGNYQCGDTLARLQLDFHRKCYICEKPHITDIQIDHFLSRVSRPDLRCEWTNLFFSCFHCNNTKLDIPFRLIKS
jgi:5-methylcytosine-specific restriction endonuclease McrA